MDTTVFYSWQSDIRAAANRTLIEAALEAAVAELRSDAAINVQPVVDRDTMAKAGSPDIGATILEKIETCGAFVADVTIINSGSGERPTPNPNVLIELGYALKAVGASRMILVQNVAFGGPEDLPFDLRQKRVLTYESAEDAPNRSAERAKLKTTFLHALRLILEDSGKAEAASCPLEPIIAFDRVKITSDHHDYQLRVRLLNRSTRPVEKWHLDVVFPTAFLNAHTDYILRVTERSNRAQCLFRSSDKTHGGAIYPGDERIALVLDYHVNSAIYSRKGEWQDLVVTARAYVEGEVSETSCLAKDIQVF